MRSIHAIRLGQAKAGGWDPTMKTRKREKSVQTSISQMQEEYKESETYTYLQEVDQDLLKSEKSAFLRYMRTEVVQNQEFLDRINELETQLEYSERETLHQRGQLQNLTQVVDQLQSELDNAHKRKKSESDSEEQSLQADDESEQQQ